MIYSFLLIREKKILWTLDTFYTTARGFWNGWNVCYKGLYVAYIYKRKPAELIGCGTKVWKIALQGANFREIKDFFRISEFRIISQKSQFH